jgi:hypothetical protein
VIVLAAAVTIGLAQLSCSENSSQDRQDLVLRPGIQQTQPDLSTNITQSVTGNGHLIGDPPERTVVFSIKKYADGTVSGWYHSLKRGPGGANIRVRVECLHISGNEAWAGGTVVAAVNPDNIGLPYSFRFLDNGEGAGAPSDEIGTARFVEYDCTTEPDINLRQLRIGNLQIRN